MFKNDNKDELRKIVKQQKRFLVKLENNNSKKILKIQKFTLKEKENGN